MHVVSIDHVDIREDVRETTISYRAGPGERNRLVARPGGATVLLIDPGARVKAGDGCRSLGAHRARCRFADDLDRYFYASLRDGNDRFEESASATFAYVVDGGSGADRLEGGPGEDSFDGGGGRDVLRGRGGSDGLVDGPGRDRVEGGAGPDFLGSYDGPHRHDDRFNGGAGRDSISYRSRARPVIGRVDRFAGVGGERDRLVGIEGLEGGSADDVLRGTNGRDQLGGRGGNDRLIGRGGDDRIRTGSGTKDRVFAGRGADFVVVSQNARVGCGGGRDFVQLSDAVATLLPDCERVGEDFEYEEVPAQPLDVTQSRVLMLLPCASEDTRGDRRVRLVTGTTVVAEGTRAVGKGHCRVSLRLLRPLRRPVRVTVKFYGPPQWSFVLQP